MLTNKKILIWIVVVVLGVLFNSGCSDDRKLQAQNKVNEFHKAYNKNDFDFIYALFTEKIKSDLTKDQSLKLFNKEKHDAGEYISMVLIDYKETTYINKKGVYLILTYRSLFSKADVEEIFYFNYEGSEPKLSGYRYTAFEKDDKNSPK